MNNDEGKQVFIGDVVQLPVGGCVIVETVGSSSAEAIPLGDPNAKPQRIKDHYPPNLIVERRGEVGLKKFLEAKTKKEPIVKKTNKVKLEPGDYLCYQGTAATVVSVSDDESVIGTLDGRQFKEKRMVNDVFMDFKECGKTVHQRLDETARAENLKKFLAAVRPPASEVEAKGGGEHRQRTTETGDDMTKKKRVRKAAIKATAPKTEKKASAKKVQLFGSSPVRVAMAAGKAGAAFDKVVAVFKANGIKLSDGTIKVNMRHGKNGMKGAELTTAQLAEFGV